MRIENKGDFKIPASEIVPNTLVGGAIDALLESPDYSFVTWYEFRVPHRELIMTRIVGRCASRRSSMTSFSKFQEKVSATRDKLYTFHEVRTSSRLVLDTSSFMAGIIEFLENQSLVSIFMCADAAAIEETMTFLNKDDDLIQHPKIKGKNIEEVSSPFL